jgi:3-hydroxyisobutyrate dehydrogenase/glyoxylate/succinic semialdehyde reductase
MRILFVGLGQMGRRMARRLGPEGLTVWNRSTEILQSFGVEGFSVATDLNAATTHSDLVITMLRDDVAVEELGMRGFFESLAPGSVWIDMTTGNPSSTRRYREIARWRKFAFIAAPVSGSLRPAETGNLLILAGGDPDVITTVDPVLSRLGTVVQVGDPEQALTLKLAFNMLLAFYIDGVAEALQLTDKADLPRERVLRLLQSSSLAAAVLQAKSERWARQQYEPEFPIAMLSKDLNLAADWGKRLGAVIKGTGALREVYHEASKTSMGGLDMSAVADALAKT